MISKVRSLWGGRSPMRIKDNIFVLAVLFTGLGLRIWALSYRSLFSDEVFMLKALQTPFSGIFTIDAPHGPLHFYAIHFLTKITGFSEFWLRLPSALFGVAACFAVYLIALELFDNKTSRIALVLAVLSPFLVLYDRTGRWYSLYAMTSAFSVYYFIKMMRKDDAGSAVMFFLWTLALLYTETISVFIVAFELAASVLYFKKISVKYAVLLLLLSLLYIPWICVFAGSLSRVMPGNFIERGVAGGVIGRLAYLLFSFSAGQTVSPFNFAVSVPAVAAFACLVTIACYRGLVERSREVFFVALYMLFSSAQVLTQVNLPHYMMDSAAPFYILAAVGLNGIKRRQVMILAMTVIACVYSYSLFNLYSGNQFNRMELVDDWRGVASFVKGSSSPGDLVISSNNSFAYYLKDRPNTASYSGDRQELYGRIDRFLSDRPNGRILLVSTPLSGMFTAEAEAALSVEEYLSSRYRRIGQKMFSADPDHLLKRKFVKRTFPAYRISVNIYSNIMPSNEEGK